MPESPISNPLAPPSFIPTGGAAEKPLSNADFRKIMMTPRATPARSGGGGGGRGGGGGGGRPRGGDEGGGGEAPAEGDEDRPISNPVRPVKQQKRVHDEDAAARQKAKKWQGKKKDETPAAPKYRDRAKERRDEANPDYEDTEVQLAGFHSVPPPDAATSSKAELQKLSIDNSKYLGGDMEHTHLVKGLDFALLARVKNENHQKEKEDKEKTIQDLEEKQAKAQKKSGLPPMKAPTVATALGVKKVEAPAAPAITVLTPMGKSILQTVTKTPTKNELFMPGRMAFVFDLEDEFRQELPTTLLRSKEDCPKEVNSLAGKIDAMLLEKIEKVMNFLRQGSKTHKKLKKKDKTKEEDKLKEEKPAPKPVVEEEEENIFGEVGTDYVVAKNKEDASKQKDKTEEEKASVKKDETQDDGKREDARKSDKRDDKREERRDDRRDDTKEDRRDSRREERKEDIREERRRDDRKDDRKRDERDREDRRDEKDKKPKTYFQTPAESYTDVYSATDNAAHKALVEQAKQLSAKLPPTESAPQDEKKRTKKGKDDEKKDPAFVEDTYSECYPAAYETANYAYESDDEEDITKMGSKKGKLKRWDFDDEESWNAYNDQREAMPKAAFQFGVKMSAGRKTRRNTKDNKDSHKINSILKQRAVDSVQAKKLPDAEPKGKKRRVNDD